MEQVTLKIEGMTCGHCVSAVRKVLGNIDGVSVETVQIGSAVISYDPSVVAGSDISDAIEDEGYTVVTD